MEGQKVILLSARSYRMTDEQTGQVIEGVSCWYYPAESLAPCVDQRGNKGQIPLKASLPIEKAAQIKQVPGVYEMYFIMVPGSNNSLKLKADALEFISEVE